MGALLVETSHVCHHPKQATVDILVGEKVVAWVAFALLLLALIWLPVEVDHMTGLSAVTVEVDSMIGLHWLSSSWAMAMTLYHN